VISVGDWLAAAQTVMGVSLQQSLNYGHIYLFIYCYICPAKKPV